MLRTIHTMEELDISGWMEVYREGHEENGAYFYPDEPPERALHLAEEDSRGGFWRAFSKYRVRNIGSGRKRDAMFRVSG